MPKFTIEGQVQLKYLQDHIQQWATEQPELVRKALLAGTDLMKAAVLRNMDRKLTRRTGKLRSSITRNVVVEPGGIIDGTVFAKADAHGYQPMKLRALERGSYRVHPGQVPYLMFGGRPRFISVAKARELEARGIYTPRTKGPYGIRIPKKPMVRPAFNANKEKVVRLVLTHIIDGYKRIRARGVA
jgi:hypothetical protein